MYSACRDAGINFFDTADQYNKGRSEEILGGLMQRHRDDLVIATKCFNPMGDDINARGTSRRHVARAVEASLKRLRTDRVDVLFLHQFDRCTPLEESMRALEDLVRAGKVLYPAVSNLRPGRRRRRSASRSAGWARLQVIQPMYNLVKRQAEVEILPMAEANGLGVHSLQPRRRRTALGQVRRRSGEGPARDQQDVRARYGEAWMHEVADKFAAYCKAQGLHPVSAAVAWVGAHPAVTAPIIGARSVEQLQASLDSVKIDMTPALRAEMAALSRTPPPATDRLEEQKK